MNALPALSVIAPGHDPAVVGGAGVGMERIWEQLVELWPGAKLYTHKPADHLPGEHVPVRSPELASCFGKSGRMLYWLLTLPPRREGVQWFPFGAVMPMNFGGAAVTTIYDTLEKDFPSSVPFAQRLYRAATVQRTVERSCVVTSSQFSAERLRSNYGVDAHVIPLGFEPLAVSRSVERKISEPYVFYPAIGWEHKNHRFLLDAWSRFPRLRELTLVFTLAEDHADVASRISSARKNGIRVRVTGRVSQQDLLSLYEHSEMAVFPSLYEGFGLPAVEALSLGCPILLSDCGALREAVTKDYPFVLPLEAANWCDAILSRPRTREVHWPNYVVCHSWREAAVDYKKLFLAQLS